MNQSNLKTQFPEVFPKAKWTVIILINGENDLMAEVELAYNQLANVGSCFGDVNFVVVFDGLSINDDMNVMQRSCTPEDKSYPNVYYVTKCRNLTTTAQPYRSYRDKENLAGTGTLSFILKEVVNSFPADHFGFIYKGHGGAGRTDITSEIFRVDKVRRFTGESDDALYERLIKRAPQKWELKDGFYYELNRDQDVILALYRLTDKEGYDELTYARLRDELRAAGFSGNKKLSFLCLDCCWGQIMENADLFKDTTDYFLGSSDEMPVMGIGYEEFADFLVRNRDIRPDEIANGIVAVFFKNNFSDYQSSPKWANMGVSMTCVDMIEYSKVGPMMEDLTEFLTANVEDLYLVISMARHVCMEYTNDLNPADYGIYSIDLIWFLENLAHFNDKFGESTGSENHAILAAKINALFRVLYSDFQTSHMAANYTRPTLGNFHMGGNGIALTFPKDEEAFATSLYGRSSMSDLRIPIWEQFLNAYMGTQKRLAELEESDALACHIGYLQRFYEIDNILAADRIARDCMIELRSATTQKWQKKPGTIANTQSLIDTVRAIRASQKQAAGKAPSGGTDDKKTGVVTEDKKTAEPLPFATITDPGGKKTSTPLGFKKTGTGLDGEKKTGVGLNGRSTVRERK